VRQRGGRARRDRVARGRARAARAHGEAALSTGTPAAPGGA
jgi:hypothetical protein